MHQDGLESSTLSHQRVNNQAVGKGLHVPHVQQLLMVPMLEKHAGPWHQYDQHCIWKAIAASGITWAEDLQAGHRSTCWSQEGTLPYASDLEDPALCLCGRCPQGRGGIQAQWTGTPASPVHPYHRIQ